MLQHVAANRRRTKKLEKSATCQRPRPDKAPALDRAVAPQLLLSLVGWRPTRPTNPQIFQLARVLVDRGANAHMITRQRAGHQAGLVVADRKSTRLNSSHLG